MFAWIFLYYVLSGLVTVVTLSYENPDKEVETSLSFVAFFFGFAILPICLAQELGKLIAKHNGKK